MKLWSILVYKSSNRTFSCIPFFGFYSLFIIDSGAMTDLLKDLFVFIFDSCSQIIPDGT